MVCLTPSPDGGEQCHFPSTDEMSIQSNLSIADTFRTFQKCPLYRGVHFKEVKFFFKERNCFDETDVPLDICSFYE
jgi:hypothetical protein